MRSTVLSLGLLPTVNLRAADLPANGVTRLEEIVVTAQKRRENVQNAPLTVTAFSAATLKNAGVTQVSDLQHIDPALQINTSGGTATVFVRGAGNFVTTVGNEASVPIYIDDVYYLRPSPTYFDLSDIDHVEILKGPQGTLFGRNASAGVVSIYTRDPGRKRVIEGSIGYASYNTPSIQLYLSTPITDTLATNLSVSSHYQFDGWGKNVFTGQSTYRDRSISIRSKTLWTPNAETSVRLILYYTAQYTQQSTASTYYRGTFGGDITTGPIFNQGGFYDSQTNYKGYITNHSVGGSVRVDHQIGFADLSSITAARRNYEIYYADADLTSSPIANDILRPIDYQFSQEFQIKSKEASKLKWIAGFYYLNAFEGYDPVTVGGTQNVAGGISSIDIVGLQRTKSYAEYGQATYPVWKDTNLTVGLRYTIDQLHGLGRETINTVPGSPLGSLGPSLIAQNANESQSFNKLTYRFALDHRFTRDIMAYASYSRGYKSGTYNTIPLGEKPLNPEVIDAYEVGAKLDLFDRRLRFDGSLFRDEIANPQVQSSQNGLIFLINAGAAVTQGAEFEANAVLAPGLKARLGATYLDAHYTDFQNAPLFFQIPTGGAGLTSINASGKSLPRASKFKVVGGIDYSLPIVNVGTFGLDANFAFSSRYYWDPDNVLSQRPMTIWDAALSYEPEWSSSISYRIWGKNLSNVHYYASELENQGAGAFASIVAPPRTVGANVDFKF